MAVGRWNKIRYFVSFGSTDLAGINVSATLTREWPAVKKYKARNDAVLIQQLLINNGFPAATILETKDY